MISGPPHSPIRPFLSLTAMAGHLARMVGWGILLLVGCLAWGESSSDVPEAAWLVRMADGHEPQIVAASMGAVYLGPLEGVSGYHRISFYQNLQSRPGGPDARAQIRQRLEGQSAVLAFEEEEWITRYPRAFTPADPRFPEQWHLENVGQSGGVPFSDIRVRPVWDAGINGNGVVIAIVDEGIEFRHPDLFSNWLPGSGYDYNSNDSDPSPSGSDDRHGTAVAGISLAASNGLDGLGVAYRSQLVPLRLIAGAYRTGQEAEALSYRKQEVDIYNNSWGPSDDFGVRYSDASEVLKTALEDNVRTGRGGLGNIYVWAAGNGGLNGDNSNYDGYNASPYTISVGAVGQDDIKAGYSEPGANLLVVAPSGGRGAGILTTDNTGFSGYASGDVYDNFSGTSAAAPIVSGVVALLLQARPDLGWRDVQQILALSASPVDFSDTKWSRNGAGHWVSHDYGFGRVDAAAALALAEGWPVLGALRRVQEVGSGGSVVLPQGQTVRRSVVINPSIEVQLVRLTVSIFHGDWGDLEIALVSPAGTRSILAEPHANANSDPFGNGLNWTYLSTHYLGESSSGAWTLEVSDRETGGSGSLQNWSIELLGTDAGPLENRSPVAPDISLESVEFPLEVDVLEGVFDPDGDPVRVIAVQAPRTGVLEDLGAGRFAYTMQDSPDGSDLFSVLFTDGKGGVARRLVQVLDPRPAGINDLFPVLSGSTVELPVLRNDLDPDGDALRLTGLSGVYSGVAEVQEDGKIRYRSPDGFTGVERIQYFLTDDSDGTSAGWATVIVQTSAEVALQFDGEDDHLLLEDATDIRTTDRFTVEAWIYPESYGEYVTGFGRIFDRDTFVFFLNGFDHSFYNDRSLVAYFVLDNGQAVAANSEGGVLELNKWQHVALSYDSTSAVPVRLYLDGAPVSLSYPLEGTSAPRRPISDNRNQPLYIGESSSEARAFKGRMTEFRIWDRVLDPGAVAASHNLRLTGSEPGLRLHLPLDRTLEPVAFSTAEVAVTARVIGAQRVPLELPWAELERHYTMTSDSGSGWWKERTLGWLYGDLYPWIFLPSLEWVYSGHGVAENRYLLYRQGGDWGWVQTRPGLYPWFQHLASQDWFWYLEGSRNPSWFYWSGPAGWITGNEALPGR